MYSFLYQGVFGLAFLNFLVFWTDLFFSTYLFKNDSDKKKWKQRQSNSFRPAKTYGFRGTFEILEFFTSIILWFLLTLLLFFRYLKSNHFPLANFYEALIFLTWGLVTVNFFLLFGTDFIISGFSLPIFTTNRRKSPSVLTTPETMFSNSLTSKSYPDNFEKSCGAPQENIAPWLFVYNQFLYMLSKPQKKIYGGILAPCILFVLAFAQFNLSSEFSPLVPALKSNWLLMHVSIMIFSYTIFIVAGLISLILIIQNYYRPRKNLRAPIEDRSPYQLTSTYSHSISRFGNQGAPTYDRGNFQSWFSKREQEAPDQRSGSSVQKKETWKQDGEKRTYQEKQDVNISYCPTEIKNSLYEVILWPIWSPRMCRWLHR